MSKTVGVLYICQKCCTQERCCVVSSTRENYRKSKYSSCASPARAQSTTKKDITAVTIIYDQIVRLDACTMGFRHPFQCIEQIPRVGGANKFLVAAAGGNIFTFDFCTGERLSCWPQIDPAEQKEPANPENEHDTVAFSQGKADEEPPGKRQKLSGREENGSNDSNKSASFRETWATIPILKVTARGTHVVAMTAEDKCIRVFMVNECGRLSQISER